MEHRPTINQRPTSSRSKKLVRIPSCEIIAAAGLFIASIVLSAAAAEPSDPILDLLLQKGVVSEQEVQQARAQAAAIRSNALVNTMPPMESKWRLNKAIKDLELYGDLRLRYERRDATGPDDSRIDLERLRYAVRVGLRGDIFDDFYFGFRLDTAANPRSAWVTLGSSSSGTPYQGPFGKSTGGINVGQVYLGWRHDNWLDVTIGKMANPLYTTPMVWDSDLTPEGFAERFKYTVGEADFFLTLGQFLYQDTNPTHSTPGFFNIDYSSSNPAFLLAWQLGVNYHITDKLAFKIGPALYNYTGHGVNATAQGAPVAPDFSGTFVGQGATNNIFGPGGAWSGFPNGYYDGFTANQTGINDLLILDIPWEFNLRLERLNLRLFGDYAQNLQGSERAEAAFVASRTAFQPITSAGIATIPSPQTSDTKAYQVGFAIGNKDSLGLVYGTTSRKHGWEFRTYWQHVEQYALDVNLIDSDFFEGRGNLQGIFGALAYGFTDNVTGTLRYGYASRINDALGTGGSNQDIPQINPIQHYNILQVDFAVRF
jgi:hypothetical protein